MRNESRYSIKSATGLKAYDAQTQYLLGNVADISQQGLRLISDSQVETGTLVRLRLQMRINADELLKFEILVNAQWCHKQMPGKDYEIGFKVLSQSAELNALVQRLERLRSGKKAV